MSNLETHSAQGKFSPLAPRLPTRTRQRAKSTRAPPRSQAVVPPRSRVEGALSPLLHGPPAAQVEPMYPSIASYSREPAKLLSGGRAKHGGGGYNQTMPTSLRNVCVDATCTKRAWITASKHCGLIKRFKQPSINHRPPLVCPATYHLLRAQLTQGWGSHVVYVG